MRTRFLSAALVLGVLVSASGVARAQYYNQPPPPPQTAPMYSPEGISDWTPKTRLNDLSVMAWLPWYFGFGIGGEVRYEIFILPNGFIPTVNDSFSIEPSIGLAYTNYGAFGGYSFSIIDIAPALYGNWSFYFSNAFRLYVGLGLGYNIGIASTPNGYLGNSIGDSFFYWDIVGGLSYKFTQNIGLRAEVGSQGLKAGLSFYF